MALQVWLPLNGNLNNQGLVGNVTVTNNGATVDTSGKIGSCYSFTINQYMEVKNIPFSSLSTASVCFWIKIATSEGDWLPFTGQSTSYYILATSNGTGGFYHQNAGSGTIYCDGVVRTSPIKDGNWHHYCITGVNLSTWTKFLINNYGGTGAGWNFNGQMNDIRIYDHCLSPKEVHEISKALVLHYSLDDIGIESNTTNISTQGNCSGWNNSGTSTRTNNDTTLTDIPEPSGKTVSIREDTDGQCAITFGSTSINVPSKTLTASVWFYVTGDVTSSISPYIRSSKTDGNIGNLEYNGSSSIASWPKDTWIRLTKTITTNSEATTVYFCAYTAKAGVKFYFNGWQIEENDHATMYVNGSRTNSIVFDNSGYCNDGTITGNLQITGGSGRYLRCANLNGSTYISGPYLPNVAQTAAFWLFVPSTIPSTGILFLDRGSQLAFGWWSSGSTMICACTNSCQCIYSTSYLIKNAWNHIVIVRPTGSSAPAVYVNGELKTNNGGSDCWGGGGSEFTIGTRTSTTPYPYTGKISDFRLYATALSADDVKSLYSTMASIDSSANMYTYEYNEVSSTTPKVHRTGVTDSSTIIEPDEITNASFSKTGIIKSRQFYEV